MEGHARAKPAEHPTNKLTIPLGSKEAIGYRVYDFAGLHEVPELRDYMPLAHYTDDFDVYKWKGERQPAAHLDYEKYLSSIISIRKDKEYIEGSRLLVPLGKVTPSHYV